MRGLLACVLAAAACAPSGPPSRTPDIVGVITRTAGDRGSILVEENAQDLSGSAKAWVRIDAETRVWDRTAPGAAVRLTPSDLRAGLRVGVWFVGPVAESYPVQARASDIAVVGASRGP